MHFVNKAEKRHALPEGEIITSQWMRDFMYPNMMVSLKHTLLKTSLILILQTRVNTVKW